MSSESCPDSVAPLITVVVPAYNLQAYLPDTIQCIQDQDHDGPVQIVILNDGSTDDTLAVAKKLASQWDNVTVISQDNQGRARTRERLLHLAKTELIAWIDADDMAAPNWLSGQASFLIEHSEFAAVGAHGYAMTPRGFAIGPIVHPLEPDEIDRRHLNGEANAFFQSCVLTRRSKMILAGGYNSEYPAAEDFDLWLRLFEVAPIANLDETHLLYRVHGTSANWTLNIDQRQQGHRIMNEARVRRGLLPKPDLVDAIPPAKKDDWNRRIYWMNIALRSGNPLSAISFGVSALKRHPGSLLIWGAMAIAVADCLFCFGNQTSRFRAGRQPVIRTLPWFSAYRLARYLVRRRRLRRNSAPSG